MGQVKHIWVKIVFGENTCKSLQIPGLFLLHSGGAHVQDCRGAKYFNKKSASDAIWKAAVFF